jgi:hypothetical protein
MALEDVPQIPTGDDERVAGYAVTGSAFASGHVLAFQRIPALNIGPPHSAVWLRDPEGVWTLYIDGDPRSSLGRYVAPIVKDIQRTRIHVQWLGPSSLAIDVPGAGIFWHVRLGDGPGVRLAGFGFRMLPGWATRSRWVLRAAGAVSAPLLRSGRIGLAGRTPAGHRVRIVPHAAWPVAGSVAMLNGIDLGKSELRSERTRVGGMSLPRRGLLVAGAAHLEPESTAPNRVAIDGTEIAHTGAFPAPSGA